jgi:hypothetical protein
MLLVVEVPDQAERPLVKVAAGEDPPWSEKNGVPWIFFRGRVGSLDEGAGVQRQRSGGARVIVREIPPTTKPAGA